jgi:hypothetical protein
MSAALHGTHGTRIDHATRPPILPNARFPVSNVHHISKLAVVRSFRPLR